MKGKAMDSRNLQATRRVFLGGATALAATAFLPRISRGVDATKPNSVFNGVRIGTNTYSYRGEITSAEATLNALVEDGLSEVELKEIPIYAYTGLAPDVKRKPPVTPNPEQRHAQLAKCSELRKMYNDTGVTIHIHKIPFGQTDEAIDFNFQVAVALGCTAITLERSEAMAKKLAPFAEKYKVWIGFHNHTENYPALDKTDPILEISPYIGFNFDIGHYFAGTKGKSPIPVLEKYHDRIVSLHLKDRTAKGGNVAWGTGETPIKAVLQLMKTEKWAFPADIELEYKIPAGSTAVAEVAKCVRYCKEALA
jgi:sugar phosphate isomerase/epimerase